YEEAHVLSRRIADALDEGMPGTEILALARTAYATQPLQRALAQAGIAHRVLGALGLYERSEVKDALAYLTLVANPLDAQAFRRAVQSPRRGVGPTTASRVVAAARAQERDLIDTCARAQELDGLRQAVRDRLATFGSGLKRVRGDLDAGRSVGHAVLATAMLDGGLVRHFQGRRDRCVTAKERWDSERVLEDLRSLCRAAQSFEAQTHTATLQGFLEQAAGLHAQELEGEEDSRLTVSTIHRAKGGEARLVIVIGCEERLLPSWRSLSGEDDALAEERRLFYVAVTRAKDELVLCHAAIRGGRPTAGPSRFLSEAGLLEPPRAQAA
ncbi:MAG: ATP-dependent helicase, partial [Actinomycetota bacterium]|nr:ATP-dependent helicase [Actinomycetota bacterium]